MRDEDKLKALIIIILTFCFVFFVSCQKKKLEFQMQRENDRMNIINKAINELSKNNNNLINILSNKLEYQYGK